MKKYLLSILLLIMAFPAFATVSTETTRVAYTCNGTSTTYAYTFKILADADLQVIKTLTATGAETTLTLATDYTVTGAGTASGNVVLTAGSKCASGYTMTILRDMDVTQETDYVDGDAFSAESIESALDKNTMILQQQKEELGRAPMLRKSSTITGLTLPDPEGSKYIGWNSAGTDLINISSVSTSTGSTNVLYLSNYASLAAAITSIGSSEKTLFLDTAGTISVDTTTPSTLHIVATKMGVITIATGKTLTINGPFEAGLYQVFSGSGTVAFSTMPARVDELRPEWWGAIPDGVTDCAAAINAAIAASYGKTVRFASGDYLIKSPIYWSVGFNKLIGTSKTATAIVPDGASIAPSSGTYSGINAMIIITESNVAGEISRFRFNSKTGVNFTGYTFYAYEGPAQALFDTILSELWWSMGQNATFFYGSMAGCLVTNCKWELSGTVFHLIGPANGDNILSDNLEWSCYAPFIYSDYDGTNGLYNWLIDGLTISYYLGDGDAIYIRQGTRMNLSNINFHTGDTMPAPYTGGFLKIEDSNKVMVSNAIAYNDPAARCSGITIDNSEVSLDNVRLYGMAGTPAYNLYVTGASNNVSASHMYVTGGTIGGRQIVTEDAGGRLAINDSVFTQAPGALMVNLGTETLDVSITNSELIYAGYGSGSSLYTALEYATSGTLALTNNKIGTKTAADLNSVFSFTGAGSLLIGGNEIIGIGSTEFNAGSTQLITLVAPNSGSSVKQSGTVDAVHGTTSTTISNRLVTATSKITLTATNSIAAGLTGVYVDTITPGTSFVVHHSDPGGANHGSFSYHIIE